MLIEKTNVFFNQHGIEKDVWSQMFCTTSRRTRSTKGSLIGKNEKTAPNINLFSKAIKGKYKITWKISDRDFADTLVTAIYRTFKKDFYNFCKENLSDISVSDINSINEEIIYNMIRSLVAKIRAESLNIPKCKNTNSDCIESGVSSDLSDNIKLLTNTKTCRPIFKGREQMLFQIYDHLQRKNHFLFLQGIGGIGKSECAKQFAEKFKNQYDVVVFSECPDSLVSSVNDNSIFALTAPFSPKQSFESDKQFYERKLKQLKMVKEKVLIILDNVDYFSEEIDDFLTMPFDIIITTRYDYFSEYPGQTIYINEIENMAILKDIFSEYYGKNVSNDPFTEKIINMFEHHTMAIELIAKQAKASNLTPQEIFDIMNNGDGYEFQEIFRVMNYDRRHLNILGYMQKLFNIASLTEQEQYIMMCLSLLPLTGIEKRRFKNCCGLKDYSIINKLIELSWIRDIDGQLSIHTLVKETIKIFCKPDLIKCKNFINGLMQEYPSFKCYCGNYLYKEEVQKIALNIYNIFPEPELQSWKFYEWMDMIFSPCNHHDISQNIAEKLYILYKSAYGENHFRTAKMIVRIGCSKRKYDDVEDAVMLMKKGREIIVNLKSRTPGENLYISDTNLTITDTLLANYDLYDNTALFDEIENLCLEAISIRRNLKEVFAPLFVTLVPFYNNLARLEIYRNNYKKVSDYLEIINKECSNLEYNYTYFLSEYVKEKLALEQGSIKEAVGHMEKAVKIRVEFFGEYDITSIRMRTELGDIYLKLGDISSALVQYKTSMEHLEKMPCQNTKIHTYLSEKIDSIENK